jgi:hypothetical protein
VFGSASVRVQVARSSVPDVLWPALAQFSRNVAQFESSSARQTAWSHRSPSGPRFVHPTIRAVAPESSGSGASPAHDVAESRMTTATPISAAIFTIGVLRIDVELCAVRNATTRLYDPQFVRAHALTRPATPSTA